MNKTALYVVGVVVVAVFGLVLFQKIKTQSLDSGMSKNTTAAPLETPSSNNQPGPGDTTSPSSVQMAADANIIRCVSDQGAYIGGCSQGYTCFEQGNEQSCARGRDCSKLEARVSGDNKCHKSCVSNNECLAGFKCTEKEVWHGDYAKTYKLCL